MILISAFHYLVNILFDLLQKNQHQKKILNKAKLKLLYELINQAVYTFLLCQNNIYPIAYVGTISQKLSFFY